METPSAQTKVCTYCKSEIPKSATHCPKCTKDLRNFFARHPIMTVLVVLFIIGQVSLHSLRGSTPGTSGNSTNGTIQTQQATDDAKAKELEAIKKKLQGLQIAKSSVADEYGFEHLYVTVKNNTGRDIDAFSVKAVVMNNYNQEITESISGKPAFRGVVQELVGKNKSYSAKWQLSLFQNATKIKSIEIDSIHFPDTNETVVLP